jgi:hypothetical protein
VGGYTLTEVLSVGERANVFAAVPAREPPESLAACSVVVKVRLGGAGTSVQHARFRTTSHLAELEVLRARPIAAMPRLLEVVRDGEGRPALVLARCEGRPLSEVVRASGDCGDSVVRAIGAEVRRLHEAGWAHGGLDPGSVLVRDDGAVTLVGFGCAVARGAPGFDDAVARDVAWVSRLARARGLTVRQAAGAAAGADAPAVVVPERGAGWAWPDERALVPAGTGDVPRVAETVDPALAAVGELLRAVRAAPGGWLRRLPRRAITKVWIAAAVVAVVLTAVVVLVPSAERAEGGHSGGGGVEGGGTGAGGVDGGGAGAGGVDGGGIEAGGVDGGGAGAGGVGSGGTGESGAEGDGVVDEGGAADDAASTTEAGPAVRGGDPAVQGDDPVAATAVLLRTRAECFAAEDAACLDGVDQWGSPALAADLEELQTAERRTPAASPGVEALRLVLRVGDFALVEVIGAEAVVGNGGETAAGNGGETAAGNGGETAAGSGGETAAAPLLVVRGGAGWRVRSYGSVQP